MTYFITPQTFLITPRTFWLKVERQPDGCWLWRGRRNNNGYGLLPKHPTRMDNTTHRYAYRLVVGPVPDGYQLDHLCRVRNCVNPAHLEVVTSRENTLRGESVQARNHRKDRCLRGHLFDEANTQTFLRRGNPTRRCRACHNELERRQRHERREAMTP